jgi:hypothetical protein
MRGAAAMTERDKGIDDPMLFEEFERARLDTDRAGFVDGVRGAIDDAHAHAGTRQTHGCRKTGGTGTDDQDLRPLQRRIVHAALQNR